jgi:hypothetical protein
MTSCSSFLTMVWRQHGRGARGGMDMGSPWGEHYAGYGDRSTRKVFFEGYVGELASVFWILKGVTIPMAVAQVWKSSKFTIERNQGKTPGTVIFRLSGPFTARDMRQGLMMSGNLNMVPAMGRTILTGCWVAEGSRSK